MLLLFDRAMTLVRQRQRPDVAAPARVDPTWIVAALLGVFGFAVSVLGSWVPSLWGDEAASILSANRSIPSLFNMLVHVDAVHGAYYLGLHFWVELFGNSAFSVRFPSAVAIGVCVAGVVLLATKLDSLKLGVVAGFVCAILPRVTGMGDEARSYAFSAAIATWLTLLLVEMLLSTHPSRRQWVVYGVLLAVGIYTFLYLVLIAVAHLVIILSSPNSKVLLRTWLRTLRAVGIALMPLLVLAALQHSQISFLATQSTTDFYSLVVHLWFGTPLIALLSWAAIIAAIGFFVYDLRQGTFTGQERRGLTQSVTFVGMVWLFVPVILLYLSNFLIPDFTARYLSMCAPAAALLIAVGVVRLAKFKTVPIVLIGALLLAAVAPNWVEQRSAYGKNNSDWSVISAEMAANAHPGDAVAFDDVALPSLRTRLAMRTYPIGFAGLNDFTLKSPYFAGDNWYDETYSIAEANALGRLAGVSTVWLIDYAAPANSNASADTSTAGVAELLALGFTQTFTIVNHRSIIRHFSR